MASPGREHVAFDKASLTCKNVGFVDGREFSQLLLLPCFDWQRDVLMWDELLF
ncbi:hypothetical protein ARUE_232p01780 (plasmid) [Arthrobacter sp. Rue61a]|nr:hypothetical protein ARUE_232p01780 [Arthrobacter sp. Rue61a]